MKMIRFIWNIIRVASFFMLTGQWRSFMWKVADGLPQVWAALTVKEDELASDEVYNDRMNQCADCPVFDSKIKTCGNPWDKSKVWDDPSMTDSKVPMGCFCQMEYKARLNNAACWLNKETDYAYGWKRRD